MWKKFKSFYNKDNYDFSKELIDPLEFHQTFYKVLVLYKIGDLGNKNPPSFFNQNGVLFIVGFIATMFTLFTCYNGVLTVDIPLVTEAGTYTLLLGYKLLILTCTRNHLPQYHNLLRALQQDFNFICTDGKKYRDQYLEEQLKTWKVCILICLISSIIPFAMNIFAYLSLFYFLSTHDADAGGSRPLLFPFWLPNVDFSKSPVYEIAFMFANICVILYSYNYVFMMQTQVMWIRQITSKIDIVIWSIQDLLVDIHPANNTEETEHFSHLIQTRMRDIVTHHQSMFSLLEDYASVYKKLLLFEQTICGPVVCLTAYCFAEKMDRGEFPVILLILCVATFILHFISSFLCTYLTNKVKSVCDACWGIPFWNAGPVIRPYLVIIIQRSLRPLPLQAPGFQDISIETFSQKMSSAYSMFNMLRQSNI